MRGIFVTGTDTNAGKTFASSLIIRSLVDRGFSVAGLKPIACGFEQVDGEWQHPDVVALTEAANVDLPKETVNRYAFKPRLSPHIAARQENVTVSIEKIREDAGEAAQQADFVLVEGAGGWHVPLDWPEDGKPCTDIATMAVALELPVVLVVGLRLGCLNHALLTANAILHSGLPMLGWVANHVDPKFGFRDENVATLEAILPAPKLLEIPHLDDAADLSESNVDLSGILSVI